MNVTILLIINFNHKVVHVNRWINGLNRSDTCLMFVNYKISDIEIINKFIFCEHICKLIAMYKKWFIAFSHTKGNKGAWAATWIWMCMCILKLTVKNYIIDRVYRVWHFPGCSQSSESSFYCTKVIYVKLFFGVDKSLALS